MQLLNDLITAAMALAGAEAVRNHDARLWHLEGGRRCPLGWGGCSQSVYVDLKTGEHDYGEPGGPGRRDCEEHCRHGMNPPTADEYEGRDA